ncbi:MAG TPA: AsmA-like C-terminal region-containing protein, partial [Alphaproteobacteria bacterium]|nr:AsmA-like C-terminal region-containing protein [Alphaproteobacteria bacterium]
PNVVIDHGALDVRVTQAGLSSTGRFALNGAPMDVTWHEKFHDHSGFSTDFAVKTTLDDEARAGLGFDTGTYVTGPVGVDMKIKGEGRKLRQLSGKLDFAPSAVDLGEYSFSKRSGAPTMVALNIAISEAGDISVKSATATGKGVAIEGKAELAKDGKLISANFPHLKLEGVADASANVSRQNSNGLAVRVSGAFLNIAPILKDALDENDTIGKVPWRIDANLDSVVLRGGVNARNFKATLASTGPHLSVVDVHGQFAKSGDFSASLIDSTDNQRSLVIASNDAGQLVKGATGIDSVLGGRLALHASLAAGDTALAPSAELPPTMPNAPHKQNGVSGTLKIDDFRVVNAPILAKLLTVGSLQGISDLLSGEGIQFTHLEVPFWYDKGKLGVDGRASGPAIGLTMQGIVDRKQKLTELNGTIVPAYTLNSVFGKVPVLGQLLVSRPGEGIFAFTYNIAGTTNDPQVTVNPLSALAPGFLRRLFQLGETQAGALGLQDEGQTAQ